MYNLYSTTPKTRVANTPQPFLWATQLSEQCLFMWYNVLITLQLTHCSWDFNAT